MRFVQVSGRLLWLSVGMLLSAAAHGQAVLSYGEVVSAPALHAGFVTGSNGAASITTSSGTAISGFDAAKGVLVAASATVSISPGFYLNAYNHDGQQSTGSGVQVIWGLGTSWASKATPTFACGAACGYIFVSGPSLNAINSDFATQAIGNPNATSPSISDVTTLQSLVKGSATLQTVRVDTTLSQGGTNGTNSVKITKGPDLVPDPHAVVPALPQAALTGSVSMQYSYLHHAQASFAGGSINQTDTGPEIYFDQFNKAGDALDLTVTAGGKAGDTTGLEFRGVATCVKGACGAFGLTFAPSFADVVAGTSNNRLGSVTLLGDPGNYAAVYAFTFWDTAGTGATNSQKSHIVTLTIESGVPAVPEPHSAAMLLAGLGAIGWMSRRRRSAKDQVAKV